MKAICEMTLEELKEEYLYCVVASGDEALEADNRRYYHDRAEAVKRHIEEQAMS